MRYSPIPSALFLRNRKKLLRKLEKDAVAIVHSNDRMVRSGDQYYPYRQNSDLFYLSGIEQEMSLLLICPGGDKDKKSLLFLRRPEPGLETWEGRKLDMEGAGKLSGIKAIHWLEEFEAVSRPLILRGKKIYCNIPEHEKFKPDYPSRDERMMAHLRKDYPAHEIRRLAPLMAKLRMVKEPEEVVLIRKAAGITQAALERVLGFVRPGLYEYEVEAEMSHEFIRRGAGGHAYPPIVAAGANACMLHYTSNDGVCRDGELLLMDFGAEYSNYASDCTRTIPVNGRFTKRQRELYDSVLRVFRQARSLMKPGTTIEKINEEAGRICTEEHLRLGLYSKEELKNQDRGNPLYKKYFMHGTAHFLGLDVHDVGGKQDPLKPGMVLTCEPGIYIPKENTGIRIENDILITENGHEDLMVGFPTEAGEIEEKMNAG